MDEIAADHFVGGVIQDAFEIGFAGLDALLEHQLDEVADAATVTPFVVIPAHELEEVLVQFDAGTGVEDGGQFTVDEIRAGNFIAGVAKDALEIGFAGFLHRG